MTHDYFILFANAPGILISMWLNFGAAKLMYSENFRKQKQLQKQYQVGNIDLENTALLEENGKSNGYSHDAKVLMIMTVWICTFSFLKFANIAHDRQVEVVGIIVNVNLVVFFGAPLSTISKVLHTRSSASIHLGSMFLYILNTTFWTLYGLAISSPYVAVPNGLGLLLGSIQGLLCMLFPRKVEEDYRTLL